MNRKVTINGKGWPCRLTIGVLKQFRDVTGLEIDQVKDVFSVCTLLYMACVAACKREKESFPWDSAEALMDDIALDEVERITTELFGAAQAAPSGEKKTAGRG